MFVYSVTIKSCTIFFMTQTVVFEFSHSPCTYVSKHKLWMNELENYDYNNKNERASISTAFINVICS